MEGTAEAPSRRRSFVLIRRFRDEDHARVLKIFLEGMVEMVPNVAFRGLSSHPESLGLYAALTVACLLLTRCWWVVCVAPVVVLCGRYVCSRRVINAYVDLALNGDMRDIQNFYLSRPGCCLWVAELDDTVVGLVAAVSHPTPRGALELRRMSVALNFRQRGVGLALGEKVLEFALSHGYSSVVLGTTQYGDAAHRLYRRLGFQLVGVTNGYFSPGFQASLLEKLFYHVSHHHYEIRL